MSFAATAKSGRNVGADPWIRPPCPITGHLRIGLLGGSFNPAHEGHIHVSRAALKALHLDLIWWLVSPQNPLKSLKEMAPLRDRIHAAQTLIRDRRIIVSAIEADLGTRYTADTLKQLRRRFPGVRFVWLMGSDNLLQIPRWRNWKAIFRQVPIAVVARPGTALKARCGKAAATFRAERFEPDRNFLSHTAPALTLIETRRNTASATRLRAGAATR